MSQGRRALITGVTGQDGAYLAQLLLGKGYEVYGTFRRSSSPNFWRLHVLDIATDIQLVPIDLSDASSLLEAIRIAQPDELYNLAAQSFVGTSFETPLSTAEVSGLSTARLVEMVRHLKPDTRFYQASTSEMFGSNSEVPQSETSEMVPMSPYAAAKLYAHGITRMYREAYGLHASAGILFNHESPLRGLEFVTRKISNAVAKIKVGVTDSLHLGNLEARRDWGYAPEYVEAMWLMLQQDEPADYVIATGESHSVREFTEAAFALVDLDPEQYLRHDERFTRPLDVPLLMGDATRARETLGWQHATSFQKLVEVMVRADLERWQSWQAGKTFPWDAPFHTDEMRVITRTLRV
ncbi:MAG TPA: GDP-mannose 4,6-dehydratase [Candidatus Limnocylindria bacterium]|nr:GDP-mannose 4,6-dehydratase [Candidatus Limnocylindria bacterium]